MVETADGGRTRMAVPILEDAGFGDGAPGSITFLDARHGWVVEQGVGLWRTADGTTCQPLGT